MIIGIDIGGSTTKIVGMNGKHLIEPLTVEANDPVASASGALGKFLNANDLSLNEIDQIVITGVGASFLGDELLGHPLRKVNEFIALGYGGLYLSKLDKAIIVSMGTGTAFVRAHGQSIQHLGGTGVGGGTILGLSKTMINLSRFDNIIDMAAKGRLEHVDLSVGDISHTEIGNLPSTITASNFGKMNDQVSRSDIAKGILNMVYQVIGMMAIFAARTHDDRNIVLCGKLVDVHQAENTFKELSKLYKVNFIAINHAPYCTAIGAAISGAPDSFGVAEIQ